MTAAERIDKVWTLEGGSGLLGRVVGIEERTARQKANRLRYGGLKESSIL
jgi:hypothetical protein